jgi:hypothetical protein
MSHELVQLASKLPFMSFSLAASNSRPEPAVAVRALAEPGLRVGKICAVAGEQSHALRIRARMRKP